MVKTRINKRLEHVKDGENLFVDERGVISNHELTEPINLIGMIESKKNNTSKSLPSTTRTKVFVYEGK